MANNATVLADGASQLNGYPQVRGNHKANVVILAGPSSYAAGGCTIPALAHVANLHTVRASVSVGTYFVFARISGANKVGKMSEVRILIIDVATGLQPVDTTDLSALRIRFEYEGTN